MLTAATAPKASFEANTMRIETGPLHRQLTHDFNNCHEAVAGGDLITVAKLEASIPPLLEQFEKEESARFENPSWLVEKMWGGFYVALGDYVKALEHELRGWDHAIADTAPETPEKARRQSISASNIADELLRLGRAKDALPWAQRSVELWSSNPINHLVLAMVYHRAGFHSEADEIVEQLRNAARFGDESDILASCMSYENELHAMTELPAVQRLLADIEKAWSTDEGGEDQ